GASSTRMTMQERLAGQHPFHKNRRAPGVRVPPKSRPACRRIIGPLRRFQMPALELDPVDLYNVRSMLSEEERLVQDSVAKFVDEQVLPIIGECFEHERFPRELITGVAELGLLGSSIHGYGCAGLNA